MHVHGDAKANTDPNTRSTTQNVSDGGSIATAGETYTHRHVHTHMHTHIIAMCNNKALHTSTIMLDSSSIYWCG